MRNITTTTLALLATTSLLGVAHAGDPPAAKKKAAPPAPAKVDAKPAMPKEPPPGPAMPEKPTVPTEIEAALKASKGTWKCSGEFFAPDGTSYKNKFTIKVTADLGGLWIRSEMTEGKHKATKYPLKFTSYRTYDPTSKKWNQVMLDNWGGIGRGWSTGPDATGKTVFEMEMTGMGHTMKFRDYEEPGDKKGTLHSWGEMSMDGKAWTKAYDATCKK